MIGSHAATAVAFFAAATSVSWAAAYAWARWLSRQQVVPEASRADEGRLERIETALEAIAVEVERLGEGQRFTTGLLAGLNSRPGPEALGHGDAGG